MSAFIVSKEHIDTLVGISRRYHRQINRAIPASTDFGRMLWRENLNSLKARYPDDSSGTRPGPCSFQDGDVERYQYQPMPGLDSAPIGALLKAIDCYEYQSCEHPEWDASEAKAWCRSLQRAILSTLPDMDLWEVHDRNTFNAQRRTA